MTTRRSDDERRRLRHAGGAAGPQIWATGGRPRALPPMIVTLIVLLILFSVFTDVWTQRLWYRSVGYGSVFSTAALDPGAAVLGLRPADGRRGRGEHGRRLPDAAAVPLPPSPEQTGLDRYRRGRHAASAPGSLVGVGVLSAVFARLGRAGEWRTSCCGATGPSFGVKDDRLPQGHRLLRLQPTLAALPGRLRLTAIVLAARSSPRSSHYLYGGIRPPRRARQASGAAQVQLSVLLGLLRAAQGLRLLARPLRPAPRRQRLLHRHHLHRRDNAVLPAKNILIASR